jgi:flagellar basal body-associated protein FliL
MKKMNKKKVWISLGILIPVLITAILLVITISIGGSSGTGTDSSGIPFATFFAVFIAPGIIAQQKKRREQMKEKNNLGAM